MFSPWSVSLRGGGLRLLTAPLGHSPWFKTDFHEGGPVSELTVSLYTMDERYFASIQEWFDRENFGGLPLIPIRYLLDSAVLYLGS